MAAGINKTAELKDIMPLFKDGQTILFGGFGGVGSPPGLIAAILESGCTGLTLIGNDAGFPDIGIGRAVSAGRVSKMIVSHIGSNPAAGALMNSGELEIEFSPQGTLMERIRAGGTGLGGILCDIGMGADIVRGDKQTVLLGGKPYLAETALTADIALIYAETADEYGNLIYDKSARNTNPLAAAAGRITVAEVNHIVPAGTLDPERVITPGVYVDYIIQSNGADWKWAWERN